MVLRIAIVSSVSLVTLVSDSPARTPGWGAPFL